MGGPTTTQNTNQNTISNTNSSGTTNYNQNTGQTSNQSSAQNSTQTYDPSALGKGYISAGTQSAAGGINQYLNPYQSDVIDATMKQLGQQFGQQQSNVLGNAVSANALGGDRQAIAQAALAGQQGLAAGQTLAGLNSQNYSQALGASQADLARQLQAAGLSGGTTSGATTGNVAGQSASNTAGSGATTGLTHGQTIGTGTTTSQTNPGLMGWLGAGLSGLGLLADGGAARRDAGGGVSDGGLLPLLLMQRQPQAAPPPLISMQQPAQAPSTSSQGAFGKDFSHDYKLGQQAGKGIGDLTNTISTGHPQGNGIIGKLGNLSGQVFGSSSPTTAGPGGWQTGTQTSGALGSGGIGQTFANMFAGGGGIHPVLHNFGRALKAVKHFADGGGPEPDFGEEEPDFGGDGSALENRISGWAPRQESASPSVNAFGLPSGQFPGTSSPGFFRGLRDAVRPDENGLTPADRLVNWLGKQTDQPPLYPAKANEEPVTPPQADEQSAVPTAPATLGGLPALSPQNQGDLKRQFPIPSPSIPSGGFGVLGPSGEANDATPGAAAQLGGLNPRPVKSQERLTPEEPLTTVKSDFAVNKPSGEGVAQPSAAKSSGAVNISGPLESGNRDPLKGVGNISTDTGGSRSYGNLGLNSLPGASMWEFQKEYGANFGLTAKPGTAAYDAQWRAAASKDPQGLVQAENSYWQKHIAGPAQEHMLRLGIPEEWAKDPRVLSYMADRNVQYGPNATIAYGQRIADAANHADNAEDFLKNLSDADRAHLPQNFRQYLSEHPGHINGLVNRVNNRLSESLGIDASGVTAPLGAIGNAAEEGIGALGRGIKNTVAKGFSPDVSQHPFQNQQDAHNGGLLSRIFGVNFNPLGLTEQERTNLMRAGAAMMQTGNLGAGLNAGLNASEQARAQERQAKLDAQKINMELQKLQETKDWHQGRINQENWGQPFTAKDKDGNEHLMQYDKRSGQVQEVPGYAGVVGRGGSGNAGGVSKWKYDTWLANHPGDTKGAEDFASGRKSMSSAEIEKSAGVLAQNDARIAGVMGDKARSLIEERKKYWSDALRQAGNAKTAPSVAPAPAAAQPAQTQQQPPSKPAGDPLEKARAAIAAGVPRDAVIERLHQSGIDPTGL